MTDQNMRSRMQCKMKSVRNNPEAVARQKGDMTVNGKTNEEKGKIEVSHGCNYCPSDVPYYLREASKCPAW